MKKSFIITLLITTIALSHSLYSNTPAAMNKAIKAFRGVVMDKVSDIYKAKQRIRYCVSVLDGYTVNEIKQHPNYIVAGNIYVYNGVLYDGDDIDEAIRSYEKGLKLRKDPDSFLRLAKCYKIKYNKYHDKGNLIEEIRYGQKVHYALSMFLVLIDYPKSNTTWHKIRDAFKPYTEYDIKDFEKKK